jgi:MYXO-CTERM domain-containing protein
MLHRWSVLPSLLAAALLVAGALSGCHDLGEVGDDGVGSVAADARSIEGRVVDALDGAPLAGAVVRVEGREGTVRTDARGAFTALAPDAPVTLTITAPGYLLGLRPSVEAHAREVGAIGLHPETVSDERADAILNARDAQRLDRDRPDDPALRPEVAAFLRGELDEGALIAAANPSRTVRDGVIAGTQIGLDAPPATVRIWRRSIDGASASCSGRIDVIPLEDYIKGVLPHEWIASWHDESLRAGSLAIRTYVWNWVNRGGKYDCADLDDTTRSQVYREERVARASAAVDLTSGMAITRSGGLVSGEYSAENANPTADGVSDPLCAGRELFGHGRGMCQWGSQRWALDGRDHRTIATHYWPGSAIEGGAPVADAYAAELRGMDHPAEMVSGERAVVWVELENTGRATWDLALTRLGTTAPRDHASPFYDAENWLSPHRATAPDHSDYAPGRVGRFTFMITAPAVTEATMIEDTFGLVQEGLTWFGPEDIRIAILVRPVGEPPPPTTDAGTTTPPPTETSDAGSTSTEPPTEPPTGMEPETFPATPGAVGGRLTGGCSTDGDDAPSSLTALLVAIAALTFRRRRG